MATDDDERDEEERSEDEPEDQPAEDEEEAPEEDLRDQRIAELETALANSAAQVDALSQGLFAAQVAATGRLVDPSGLPYDAALVNNPEALDAAITALLLASPHLGRIVVSGDVDQDARDEVEPPAPNLLSILKEFA